mmetsp:Transcript_32557/g.59717  ORF Transcript_32557/g.59717 Transcript_32557/m.59717 type:complete len:599 (+) Transcript_32557:74-1870(+)
MGQNPSLPAFQSAELRSVEGSRDSRKCQHDLHVSLLLAACCVARKGPGAPAKSAVVGISKVPPSTVEVVAVAKEEAVAPLHQETVAPPPEGDAVADVRMGVTAPTDEFDASTSEEASPLPRRPAEAEAIDPLSMEIVPRTAEVEAFDALSTGTANVQLAEDVEAMRTEQDWEAAAPRKRAAEAEGFDTLPEDTEAIRIEQAVLLMEEAAAPAAEILRPSVETPASSPAGEPQGCRVSTWLVSGGMEEQKRADTESTAVPGSEDGEDCEREGNADADPPLPQSLAVLRIQSSTGKNFKLEGLEDNLTLLQLKEMCAPECGVAAHHQQIFLKGKELRDEDTLASSGITEKSRLFLKKSSKWGEALEKVPTGTVPCAGGCGSYGTGREDNFCSKCFAKQLHVEREAIWKDIFADKPIRLQDEEVAKHARCAELGSEAQTEIDDVMLRGAENLVAASTGIDGLTVGVPVRIHGLRSAKELNGRCGWIVKCNEDTSRFVVKLRGEEGTKSVKAANLNKMDLPAIPVCKIAPQRNTTRCWLCSKKCGLTGFTCRCGYVFCSKHRYAEDHQCGFDHKGMGREILARGNPKVCLNAAGDVVSKESR